jgi:hypothetical protein
MDQLITGFVEKAPDERQHPNPSFRTSVSNPWLVVNETASARETARPDGSRSFAQVLSTNGPGASPHTEGNLECARQRH